MHNPLLYKPVVQQDLSTLLFQVIGGSEIRAYPSFIHTSSSTRRAYSTVPKMWCRIMQTNAWRFSPVGNNFFRRSETLPCVLMYVSLYSSLPTHSSIKWYTIICDFFFKVESMRVESSNIDYFSPKIYAVPSHGFPIIRSL